MLLPYTDYKNNILKEKAEQARSFPAKNIDLDKGNNAQLTLISGCRNLVVG